MNTANHQIATAFSEGQFPAIYNAMTDDIEWLIVGGSPVQGKENVIAFCNKMMADMAGSTLINTNYIVGEKMIAVQGYCEYRTDKGAHGRVDYCDIYSFSEGKLSRITSYVIEARSKIGGQPGC